MKISHVPDEISFKFRIKGMLEDNPQQLYQELMCYMLLVQQIQIVLLLELC